MEDICRQQSYSHSRRNSIRFMETCANSIQFADFISRGIELTTLSTCTLWWTGEKWLSQEPSSWTTTETKTLTNKLEIRNVYIACLQIPEDITQWFSKLKRLIKVNAYCKRFKASAEIPKPTGNQLTYPHKILTRLWSAVWRRWNKFLMHKKWGIKWKREIVACGFSRHCISS